jgi:hypothetical protein
MRNARIELAESVFGAAVVVGAGQVGRRVEALGVDTAGAGTVVENTDVEAATIMNQHEVAGAERGSMLRRPINGDRAPV